ncbi:MAG: class I SAM-dependent methyltransferase [Bacillota bacterium]|nr:class I SAM-dependent methyltransferase [Bacillota bacterium]
MKESFLVTTARRADRALQLAAQELARRYGQPYVPRSALSTVPVGTLVVGRDGLRFYGEGGELRFHPGLAVVRIKRLLAGEKDHLVEALDLRRGDAVLDCTLGLAADAIVASYAVGEEGMVVGVESSLPLVALVEQGLRTYQSGRRWVDEAMRRIRVVHADHREYLATCPDRSFDAVYFDPLFRWPVERSSALEPFRPLANPAPLSPEAVAEARRVARRRVVLKERRGSPEFARLGFVHLLGGRSSRVAYGYQEVE